MRLNAIDRLLVVWQYSYVVWLCNLAVYLLHRHRAYPIIGLLRNQKATISNHDTHHDQCSCQLGSINNLFLI